MADTGVRILVEVDDAQFKRELTSLVSRMGDDKMTKKLFKIGSKPYVDQARKNAKTMTSAPDVVKRYNTTKLSKRMKAPNGLGNVVAEYHKDNLARSIKPLSLRKMKRGIVIGPAASRSGKGVFKGSRVDGWYAHMVEYKTKNNKRARPFASSAWTMTESRVKADILSLFRKEVEK